MLLPFLPILLVICGAVIILVNNWQIGAGLFFLWLGIYIGNEIANLEGDEKNEVQELRK